MGTVVVTGCSTGIGRTTALLLARQGFRVIGTVRNADDGTAVGAAAAAIGVGGLVRTAIVDVTDDARVGEFAAWLGHELGQRNERLIGLVNNAGIVVAGPVEEVPLARLREVLAVNVVGVVAVTQALLPLLRAGCGRIVNVSSVSGRIAMPFLGPYAASKFALEALSDALRVELRPWSIPVVVIEPGPVTTPIWEKGERQTVADRLAPADTRYAAFAPVVEAAFQRAAATGFPPEMVAETILRALVAPRPSPRYAVVRHRLTFALLHRVVPDSVRDRLLAWRLRRGK